MSWWRGSATKVTKGSEFNNGTELQGNPTVEYHKCEYCGKEILIVDDSLRSGWGFYYGNCAVKPNIYLYSPVILAIKRYHDMIDLRGSEVCKIFGEVMATHRVTKEERAALISAISPFQWVGGNNLANLHSRCHPVGKEHQYDWDLRAGHNTIRLLCNNCFDDTKNRYQVDLDDGRRVAISVVERLRETPESVLNDLKLKGTVVGKGGHTGW